MAGEVSARTLREWLFDSAELALLDVREPGQAVLGHILFSAPLPYSRFELDLPRLVPNPGVRMVLCDDGDGVAERAAQRAEAIGYTAVHRLAGGVAAWAAEGHTLYEGVNVPSKVFGELVELEAGTPHLSAEKVAAMQAAGDDMVIVDGRPFAEFAKMNIPGASCCPNGELPLRIDRIAPDPATKIVINCAGRTRSIIGAQTLIDLDVPNPVYALENGTQGWTLSGLSLEHGADGALPKAAPDLTERRRRAQALAARHGVETIDAETLAGWLSDGDRTLYLLDVRTADERAEDPADKRSVLDRQGAIHAPGGQLVQATDQWIGVRRARLVVLDDEDVRALVTAAWLRRLGHEAVVLKGGLAALARLTPRPGIADAPLSALPTTTPQDLERERRERTVTILDLRSSEDYRAGHIPGAVWAIRPRITAATGRHVLIAEEPGIAQLAARELQEAGVSDIVVLEGGLAAWQASGLPIETTPDQPPDAERIDFLSFTHGRHAGNAEASRQYLAWEIGLVDQLDADERAVFRV